MLWRLIIGVCVCVVANGKSDVVMMSFYIYGGNIQPMWIWDRSPEMRDRVN
jgi:hypothetical protein